MPDANPRMPVVFLGHGNPMNAIESNPFNRDWRALGEALPRPDAVLMVSAHWQTRGIAVTADAQPATIHDFGAFPQALFDVRYPAPGSAALARRVAELLAPVAVREDDRWGLDHGAWSVLSHVYPKADVPVVQLSMPREADAAAHYAIGQRLRPLREENVLIMGSGNIVHNLGAMDWGRRDCAFAWAERFQDFVLSSIQAGRDADVVAYAERGADASLAVPSAEHFLPLLYVLGARHPGEAASLRTPVIEHGSLSMASVVLGAA